MAKTILQKIRLEGRHLGCSIMPKRKMFGKNSKQLKMIFSKFKTHGILNYKVANCAVSTHHIFTSRWSDFSWICFSNSPFVTRSFASNSFDLISSDSWKDGRYWSTVLLTIHFLVLWAYRQLFTSLSLLSVGTDLVILNVSRKPPTLHANQDKHVPFHLTTSQVGKSVTTRLSFVAHTR